MTIDEPNLPPEWGTIEFEDVGGDEYVAVPKGQFDAMVAELTAYREMVGAAVSFEFVNEETGAVSGIYADPNGYTASTQGKRVGYFDSPLLAWQALHSEEGK